MPTPPTKPVSASTQQTLLHTLASPGFRRLSRLITSPWRLMLTNFLAGVFYGFGTLVGLTLFSGVIIYVVGWFVDWPIIGEYFTTLQSALESIAANQE